MSIVKNSRISIADQKVDHKKYDENFDKINWKSKKKNELEKGTDKKV